MKNEFTEKDKAVFLSAVSVANSISTDQPEEVTSPHTGIYEPLLLTVPQAAHRLNLSRAMVYALIDKKEIPVIHFGRAVRISLESLRKCIREMEEREKNHR